MLEKSMEFLDHVHDGSKVLVDYHSTVKFDRNFYMKREKKTIENIIFFLFTDKLIRSYKQEIVFVEFLMFVQHLHSVVDYFGLMLVDKQLLILSTYFFVFVNLLKTLI